MAMDNDLKLWAISSMIVVSAFYGVPYYLTQGQLPTTTVTLTVTPDQGHINMSDTAYFTFNGNVQVTTLPFIVTTISINVTSEDWINDTDMNQSNIVLTGNRAADFSIYVYAPFDSLAGDSVEVVVMATWTTSRKEQGYEEDTVTAIVDQYYRVNGYAPKSYMSKTPGSAFDWESRIYINNNGNGPDTLLVRITNVTALLDEGYSFNLEKTKLNLDANGAEQIRFSITIPSGATLGLKWIFINITSQGAQDLGMDRSDEVKLQLRVSTKDNPNNNGTNNHNGGKNNDDNICTSQFIPLIFVPLGATAYGVRRIRRNKLVVMLPQDHNKDRKVM